MKKGDDNVCAHKILASANGFLCIHCSTGPYEDSFLYVYNPETKEACDRIPLPPSYLWHKSDSIGLAMSYPSKSLNQYMLVHPMQYVGGTKRVTYRFMIFSSDSRKWTECTSEVVANKISLPTNPIFANGVLYWNSADYLLCFDCKNYQLSSCTLMPEELSWLAGQEIGVCEDRLTCARMCETNLNVWMLNHQSTDNKWEKVVQVGLEKILLNNAEMFSLFLKNILKPIKEKTMHAIMVRYLLVPLPFEGGEEVRFNLTARPKTPYDQNGQLTLRYDINTRKLDEVFVQV